ncbi:MAG TPA: CHASE2 domain-containing protein [Candidatus Deferrimicrobiaceae bacterium]
MQPRRWRPLLPLLVSGILLTILGAAMCLWPPSLVVSLEGKIYDSFLRYAPLRPAGGSVTVVDIDEASLNALGQWPWPRYRVARLLERLREEGAAAVALDMVFAEPDRSSLAVLSEEIRRDLGARIDVRTSRSEAVDNDRTLALALPGGPFVLGYQFDFDDRRGDSCVLHPLRAAVRSAGGEPSSESFFDAPGVVCNLPVLSRAARSSGFFNVSPDADGVLRRVPQVIRHNNVLYPSLALATYLLARGGDVVVETGPDRIEALRLSGRRIPLDPRGNLLVRFRGRRNTFPHVSAAAVLDGTADPASLKGKIVVVGTTAAGLKEIRTTPLEAAQPGVEIHATLLDNLLAGDAIAQPRWARSARILLVLVPGFLLTALLARARAVVGLATVLPALAGIGLGSYWLLAHRQIFLPPLLPMGTILSVFTLLLSMRYLQSDREVRERTRKLDLTQDAIIQSLAALAETRHHETGGHIQRTRNYMQVLARRLKNHPRFRDSLYGSTEELLYRLAPLHDIGKVGVRDQVLLKPGALSPEEYEEMKRHTDYGAETIRMAKQMLGEDAFLRIAEEIVSAHHERWDGTGYPRGLKGEEIPVPGRLMAVADVYDAMVYRRGYQRAFSHEEAVRLMVDERGTHFDPDVLDAFLEVQEEFRRIASRFDGSDAK